MLDEKPLVLVAESHPATLAYIVGVLKKRGCEAIGCSNFEELREAEKHEIDVYVFRDLFDHSRKPISFEEAAKRIQQRKIVVWIARSQHPPGAHVLPYGPETVRYLAGMIGQLFEDRYKSP